MKKRVFFKFFFLSIFIGSFAFAFSGSDHDLPETRIFTQADVNIIDELALAAEAFKNDEGHYPKHVNDLVSKKFISDNPCWQKINDTSFFCNTSKKGYWFNAVRTNSNGQPENIVRINGV